MIIVLYTIWTIINSQKHRGHIWAAQESRSLTYDLLLDPDIDSLFDVFQSRIDSRQEPLLHFSARKAVTQGCVSLSDHTAEDSLLMHRHVFILLCKTK